jgi:hypothetical protein
MGVAFHQHVSIVVVQPAGPAFCDVEPETWLA